MDKLVAMCMFSLAASGCTTLYSEPSTWTSPSGKIYQFTAEYKGGATGKKINIYSNGEKIMVGKARYWTKKLTMTTQLNGKQAAAVCGGSDGVRICSIFVSGKKIAVLKF